MTGAAADPTRRLAPVVRLAPAKLNLTLAVVGRRPDGYHALHSVMVPLALADRLSLASAAGREDTLHVDGHDAGPVGRNLVLRAIAETRSAVSGGWPGVSGPPPALAALLDKRIPVAAGLGGGSSDAAAAMDGALEAWGAEISAGERMRVAARLGSDVPFFLAGGPALVEGRGERITPLGGGGSGRPGGGGGAGGGGGSAPPSGGGAGGGRAGIRGEPVGILLVAPAVAVPTSDVFAAFAAGIRPAGYGTARAASDHLAGEIGAGLTSAGLLARASVLASANDLLPATLALVPALVAFRRALVRLLGRPVGQSGSGPACFVLYPSLNEASVAAAAVEEAVADGRLPVIGGGGPPAIEATTIAGAAPSLPAHGRTGSAGLTGTDAEEGRE